MKNIIIVLEISDFRWYTIFNMFLFIQRILSLVNYIPLYVVSEKAMATHSSTLAWKIPWTEEPGGLPSLGLHRVGHDWSDLAAAAAWMWYLDYKESWVLKNWCFWTVLFEYTLQTPFDWKENQLVHPKGDQSWVFIGRTDVEAQTSILWPPDAKSWLTWKDPDVERLRAGGEGDDRGWDGWMESPTQWAWVWERSGNWWWTRRPGVLQSMGL